MRIVVRRAAEKFDLRVVVTLGVLLDACPALKTQAAGLEPAVDILTMRGGADIGADPQSPWVPTRFAEDGRRRRAADT
jgi:hypothetical protein